MNEAKTSEGLTLPEINTHYQDSGHAPDFHFSYEWPMPRMIAAGKGERGRNRSEYPVRKQDHGQLLAEWLSNSAKKFVNHLIRFRRIIKAPCNNFSLCLQLKFRASRMIQHCTAKGFHLMIPNYILCTGQGNTVIVIRFEKHVCDLFEKINWRPRIWNIYRNSDLKL